MNSTESKMMQLQQQQQQQQRRENQEGGYGLEFQGIQQWIEDEKQTGIKTTKGFFPLLEFFTLSKI